MAIYALILYTAGFLAPVFSGFINDGMGWEWVQVRRPKVADHVREYG